MRRMIPPHPHHTAVRGAVGNHVAFVVGHLRVTHLAQVDRAGFVQAEPQLGEVIVYVAGGHTKSNARRFVALMGEEQDRFRVLI